MRRLIAAAVLVTATASLAHETRQYESAAKSAVAVAPAARAAAAVVDAFHAALRRGDTNAAQSYLAVNALIYEAGGVEQSRQKYASHHLGADATFAQAVPSNVTRRAGQALGNMAWIATEGRTAGTYKDSAVDCITTETMVLQRQGGAWKIVHIHWSSAAGAK